MNLSVIFVNWKSEDYLRECIASIYDWPPSASYEIIVVDNASPSGTVDGLKAAFPAIKLIKATKNLGFAGANNLGFRHSIGELVLFLNPDTKLSSPAIDVMMQQAKSLPDMGVLGCRLLNADMTVQTNSILKFPRIWTTTLQIEYLRLRWPKLWGIDILFAPNAGLSEVEAVSGACMLMRREVFERIGMFSEEYFMYSEDLDLCYQTMRAGFKNYHAGNAAIVHYGGHSSHRAWQTAMQTKAELRFCHKNYGSFYSLFFWLAMVINASARLALLALMRLFTKVFRAKDAYDSTWLRWRVILRTLVTSRAV
jgi:hypothetical protein